MCFEAATRKRTAYVTPLKLKSLSSPNKQSFWMLKKFQKRMMRHNTAYWTQRNLREKRRRRREMKMTEDD